MTMSAPTPGIAQLPPLDPPTPADPLPTEGDPADTTWWDTFDE